MIIVLNIGETGQAYKGKIGQGTINQVADAQEI
jgi:hypothetical protein